MLKKLSVIAGLTIVAGVVAVAFAAAQEAPPRGQQLFLDMKCNMCHAVPTVGIEAKTSSEKMKGPDIVDLKVERDWMFKFLKREVQKDGAQHKKEFKGSDEELQALVDWLLEQKSQ